MKPGLKQIQIVPFQFRHYLILIHIVNLLFKKLNRTAMILSIILELCKSFHNFSVIYPTILDSFQLISIAALLYDRYNYLILHNIYTILL